MRGIVCSFLALFFGAVPSFASTAQSCPVGKPLTEFNLLVEPSKGGDALPVSAVNLIGPGDKLKYEPVAAAGRPKAPQKWRFCWHRLLEATPDISKCSQ
ncbi:MAG: hypothetical protein WAN10_06710 [Candidatus Acidiferrales bacterium]